MARRAAESSAKRAKKEKEDPLVRRREELILEVARVAMKAQGDKAVREATESLMQALRAVCTELEAKNHDELLKKLPDELWEKIIDENVEQNDLLALASTCRFFREKQEDLGWEWLVTKLELYRRLDERKSGQKLSHSLGWFRWVCDTFEILPGFKRPYMRVRKAVYEGDLVNYAALQGSVEILRWLVEEKGCELNKDTGDLAGWGGSVEVLGYLVERGYKFTSYACGGAAKEGHLKALKFLRGLDPPCPWDGLTCSYAAEGGQLEVLKWLRAQNPPCPWDFEWSRSFCAAAARTGNLDVLKWARDQDPPCPWDEETCAAAARKGRLDVLKWLRSQDPPCPWYEGTCTGAAAGGQLEVLKWLRAQNPPCPWDLETCSYAVYEGQLEALKWLRAQNPPCPWSRYTCRELASERMTGNDHIVDWIDQQEEKSDDGDEGLVGEFWGE